MSIGDVMYFVERCMIRQYLRGIRGTVLRKGLINHVINAIVDNVRVL